MWPQDGLASLRRRHFRLGICRLLRCCPSSQAHARRNFESQQHVQILQMLLASQRSLRGWLQAFTTFALPRSSYVLCGTVSTMVGEIQLQSDGF